MKKLKQITQQFKFLQTRTFGFSTNFKYKNFSSLFLHRKKINNIQELVNFYNKSYSIKKFNEFKVFELRSSNLRNYYHQNILAFGDLLHQLHPLAGQGFNMSVRDIRQLVKIMQFKIDHGLDLDASVCMILKKNKT